MYQPPQFIIRNKTQFYWMKPENFKQRKNASLEHKVTLYNRQEWKCKGAFRTMTEIMRDLFSKPLQGEVFKMTNEKLLQMPNSTSMYTHWSLLEEDRKIRLKNARLIRIQQMGEQINCSSFSVSKSLRD